MRLGLIVDGTDHFIKPVEAVLQAQFQVTHFAPSFIRLPLIGTRVNEYRLTQQLSRFLQDQDVVFFEWAASLLIRATQLPKHGRIVTRMHSVELATSVERVNWQNVDHLIVLNEALGQRLAQLVDMPLPPTTIIANGVNLATYQIVPRSFDYRVGMVCNLLPIKRIYETILAIHQLRQDGHPFRLQIAGRPGEGEARRYAWALENLVAALDLTEAVTFAGYVTDVDRWLHDIDIFVSNSYWEGQQMGLIEAMASGCYCVSHCWAGVEEILPRENIFTTDSDLRQKLLQYAALPEDIKRQKQQQMRMIIEEKFDEKRMVAQITEILRQSLSTK